jgi:hypothetical protein
MRLLFTIICLLLPGCCIAAIPRPDHVVVVIEENHSYSEIIGNTQAPYINALAAQGALFTQSYATTHPSQPNYIALFSGSQQGVTDNSCPHTFTAPNLGGSLIAASLSFIGYSEDLPDPGSKVCDSGAYARKHNPWVNFTDVPDSSNLPFSSFPSDFSQLPTVAFVVPNQNNDMHDGSIAQGDTWLKDHLDAYVQWAQTHNSLFILTFDEDDGTGGNRIVTLFVGPMVTTGQYGRLINHYTVLKTIGDMYGLASIGEAANAEAIPEVWKDSNTVTILSDRADSDGDGFPDELEAALVSDPFNAARTPFGWPPQTPQPLTVEKLSINLRFDISFSDIIRLRARLPVPQGFDPDGKRIEIVVGGVNNGFYLDANGNWRKHATFVRLSLKRSSGVVMAQDARLNVSLGRNSFGQRLQDENLTSSDLRLVPRSVRVMILTNGTLYLADVPQVYSARQGKFGRSR